MTDTDKMTLLIQTSPEYPADISIGDWMGEMERQRALTPEQRRQEQLDRARRDADQATADYRPTCCDLLDLPESMWVNDTYLAAGTYVCDRWEGHDGYHGGATLQGYDERGDELAPDWPGRESEVSWDDRNPNRRANR